MRLKPKCENEAVLLNIPHYPESRRAKHKHVFLVTWDELYPWQQLFLRMPDQMLLKPASLSEAHNSGEFPSV